MEERGEDAGRYVQGELGDKLKSFAAPRMTAVGEPGAVSSASVERYGLGERDAFVDKVHDVLGGRAGKKNFGDA